MGWSLAHVTGCAHTCRPTACLPVVLLLFVLPAAAIEGDSFVVGSHIQAGKAAGDHGTINTAKTVIGSGCTIMAQSVVSAGTSLAAGTILSPGSCSARPPAGPSGFAAHQEVRTEPKRLPVPLWLGSSSILVLVFSFMWLAMVPSIALWYWLNLEDADTWQDLLAAGLDCFLTRYGDGIGLCHELWWSAAVSMLLVPPTAMALSIGYMWLMVPIKWLLVGRITQQKTEAGGWRRLGGRGPGTVPCNGLLTEPDAWGGTWSA